MKKPSNFTTREE